VPKADEVKTEKRDGLTQQQYLTRKVLVLEEKVPKADEVKNGINKKALT
jgi:hypothetical protein